MAATIFPDVRQVFSQRDWPGAGDIDDCWVVATYQMVNAVAPWLPMYTVPTFRAAAGDPDDGNSDGGRLSEIMKGVNKLYPSITWTEVRKWSWDRVLAELKKGRVISVQIDSSKLPVDLRYGFTGLHQVIWYHEPGTGLWQGNPLQKDRSKPQRIGTAVAKAAALSFGNGYVYGVLSPTINQAFTKHPLYVPPTPTTGPTPEEVAKLVAAGNKAGREAVKAEVIAHTQTL